MESGLCSEENRCIFTLLPSSFVFGNWLPALQHAVWGTQFSAARARKTRQMFRGSGKANTSLLFFVNASNFRFPVDANCRHPTQSLAFIYSKSLFPVKTTDRKLWWDEWEVFTILPRATDDGFRPAINESSLRDTQECLRKNVSNTQIKPCVSCQYVRRSLFSWVSLGCSGVTKREFEGGRTGRWESTKYSILILQKC